MTLCCAYDPDFYIDLEWGVVSPGTEICIECKCLISPWTEHYRVREWQEYEDMWLGWVEPTTGIRACCEKCGDLAASLLELGYCWNYGVLRQSVRDLNE